MNLPYIIAEGGSCHEENLDHALTLTHVASDAGCQAIKWQFWSSHERMRARRNVTAPEAFRRGSIWAAWFAPLRTAAHDLGLDFLCTAFLPEDVALVAEYVDHFKVASFEHQNRPLLDQVLRATRGTDRRIFYSTGLSNGTGRAWAPRIPSSANASLVIPLHCVTAYPCPPDQANLSAITPGGGFSDHTGVHFTGGLAVAAGADYLEVHIRREETGADCPDCPDYPHSLTPDLLKQYVSFAHVAYQMRGTGQRVIQAAERENLPYLVGATTE